MSALGTESRGTLFARQFRDIEESLINSGIPCTFIRSTFFMENWFMQADRIKSENALHMPIRAGRYAPVSVEDVGKAACHILLDPTLHLNKAYDLVGPEVLDVRIVRGFSANDKKCCAPDSPFA
jgi:uncharacterized protein YbjT (DUF2867 family)